jgi:hypothetical protein
VFSGACYVSRTCAGAASARDPVSRRSGVLGRRTARLGGQLHRFDEVAGLVRTELTDDRRSKCCWLEAWTKDSDHQDHPIVRSISAEGISSVRQSAATGRSWKSGAVTPRRSPSTGIRSWHDMSPPAWHAAHTASVVRRRRWIGRNVRQHAADVEIRRHTSGRSPHAALGGDRPWSPPVSVSRVGSASRPARREKLASGDSQRPVVAATVTTTGSDAARAPVLSTATATTVYDPACDSVTLAR